VIIWYHDESIFYAHDRRRWTWQHKDAPAKPYAKGDGASFMVADFVLAKFGWLHSPDGTKSARRVMRPGKNKDGYMTNADVEEQAQAAMDILTEYYPAYEHVFVYDNAMTHLKRADGALSACKMPKNTSSHKTNWLVEVTAHDSNGKPIYKSCVKLSKVKVQMEDATFNGMKQPLYFPAGHPKAGLFKGMKTILEERGFTDASKLKAQCKDFKCVDLRANCCCCRILFNQSDFENTESLLQTAC
jgi:hypothetical protein